MNTLTKAAEDALSYFDTNTFYSVLVSGDSILKIIIYTNMRTLTAKELLRTHIAENRRNIGNLLRRIANINPIFPVKGE